MQRANLAAYASIFLTLGVLSGSAAAHAQTAALPELCQLPALSTRDDIRLPENTASETELQARYFARLEKYEISPRNQKECEQLYMAFVVIESIDPTDCPRNIVAAVTSRAACLVD